MVYFYFAAYIGLKPYECSDSIHVNVLHFILNKSGHFNEYYYERTKNIQTVPILYEFGLTRVGFYSN